MSAAISDGDLVRLARDGDPVAFRLLVERHQPMARARARSLGPQPGDVDDIVQESFLQAFIALERLRDPDRFAGWLAGIVLNVSRVLQRRTPVTLLPDWPDGLAIAITAGAPVRVSGAVMDRLAVPADASQAGRTGPPPDQTARDLSLGTRPRYEPRNMAFASGLDNWLLGGSFTEHASESHWHDYSCAAEHGTAVLASAVPQPAGFAFLGQEVFAEDYLGTSVVFRGQFRTAGSGRRAGLFLRVRRGRDIGAGRDIRGPLTEAAVLADPNNHIVTIAGGPDWTRHEITARIPGDTSTIVFGIFLAGRGRIELRQPELAREERSSGG